MRRESTDGVPDLWGVIDTNREQRLQPNFFPRRHCLSLGNNRHELHSLIGSMMCFVAVIVVILLPGNTRQRYC